MSVYIARVLGAASFGLYQFAQAFLIYLILLVDSGLALFGTKEIARDKENAGKVTLNIFAVRWIVACGLFVLSVAVLFVLPMEQTLRWLFVATFLFIFYRALSSEWVFQGLEAMEYIPLFKILITAFSLILTVGLVRGPLDLLKLPLLQAVCGFVVAFAFIFVLFKRIMPASMKMLAPPEWPSIFWQALPLGASIFMIQIYGNLDTIMLGFMGRSEIVGYYNVAYKVYFVCAGIFSAWLQTAMPVMSHRIANDLPAARVFINKYTRLTGLVFIPLTLVVFLLAPEIVLLIFGAEYLAAIPALKILIWQMLSITMGSIFSVLILLPAGRYYDFLGAVSVGALVNIILNLLLIPRFGMLGAATATIIAEVCAMLMSAYFAQRVFGIELVRQFIFPGFLAFIALLGYWGVLALGRPVAGSVYLIVYGGLVLTLERRFLFSFAREIFKK